MGTSAYVVLIYPLYSSSKNSKSTLYNVVMVVVSTGMLYKIETHSGL